MKTKAILSVSYCSVFQLEVNGIKTEYNVFIHDFQRLLSYWDQKYELEYPSQENLRLFGNYCRDAQSKGKKLAYI